MRHEDFTSIQIEDIMAKVLNSCCAAGGFRAVQWISEFGLKRVQESTSSNWQWIFQKTEIVGTHVVGDFTSDLWTTFQTWKEVIDQQPAPWQPPSGPRLLAAGRLIYPVYFHQRFLGLLLLEGGDGTDPMTLLAKIRPGLEVAGKYIAFAYQHLETRNMSYIDELTGLYNQRYLPTVLDHEVRRAMRDKTPFSVLFLDIDYFKMVNDMRGHWVGSRLLTELAGVLKQQVRACDYGFRYGGDEFIVILGGSNSEDSQRVAERIRKAVEEYTFLADGQKLKLTVSIGVASYPEHANSTSELIQLADQAMYYGKRKSRNIVFVAS